MSPHSIRRRASMLTAGVLSAALVLAGATTAVAAPGDTSSARAQFLSGSLLSTIPLDAVVGLGGAEAENAGDPTPDEDVVGLDLSALSLIGVEIAPGIDLPLGDFLTLGAVNQYAEASDEGVSRAASGAVGSNGAVSIDGSEGFPADAQFSLGTLLDYVSPVLTDVIGDVQVDLQAITGVAASDAEGAPETVCDDLSAPVDCRDYTIAGADLLVSVPSVAGIVDVLVGEDGVAETVDAAVDALAGPNGVLAAALAALTGIAGLLGDSDLEITITTDIAGSLNDVLDEPLFDPETGVAIDLRTGEVSVDLDQFLTSTIGTGLSDLAPNTEILSAPVLAELASSVASLLNQVPELVATTLDATLRAAQLHVAGRYLRGGQRIAVFDFADRHRNGDQRLCGRHAR